MIPPAPTFTKQERIVSKRLMETLFSQNGSRSAVAFPLRAVYMETARPQGAPPAQVLVSVSKRRFKHAVDRNRVKRQIREAYRQHKQLLWEKVADDRQLVVALVWLSDRHCPTSQVEARLVGLLRRITAKP